MKAHDDFRLSLRNLKKHDYYFLNKLILDALTLISFTFYLPIKSWLFQNYVHKTSEYKESKDYVDVIYFNKEKCLKE